MPNIPNGRYGNRAWDKPVGVPPEAAYPPHDYMGPFSSNSERLMSQALAVGNMTSEEVQEYVRPNLPQVELFPDKYGYTRNEYGILDIIQVGGRSNERTDFSQVPYAMQSTARNDLGTV